MHIYFCRNSSAYTVDTETSKVEYVKDTNFYISIVKKDGFINDYEGENVEVKEGDILIFKNDLLTTINKLDKFMKYYMNSGGTKLSDDCCVTCESGIKQG